MRHLSLFLILLCSTFYFAPYAHTKPLPEAVETAITETFAALLPENPVPLPALTRLLDFVTQADSSPMWEPSPRFNKSVGIFLQDSINVPLQDIIQYIANPSVPGEAVYLTSVRTNYWKQASTMKEAAKAILASPIPPKKALVLRGVEFEESTPDTSSGCYYSYFLNRLFVLMPYDKGTALICVAFMPEKSYVGKKGAILGDDTDLNYIYTPTEGTNLPMLGWAKTQVYTSATISIYTQLDNSPQNTQTYTFKWTSAGWNNLNVVEASHIIEGVERFSNSLRAFLESPNRPSPEELSAEMQKITSFTEAELFSAMQPYVDFLKTAVADNEILTVKDFAAMLKGNAYPTTFTHAALSSDLIKQYSKQALAVKTVPQPETAPKATTSPESTKKNAPEAPQKVAPKTTKKTAKAPTKHE